MSRPVIKQEGLLNNTETIESGKEKFDLHVGELLLQIVLRRLQDPHVVQFLDRRSAKRPRAAEVPAIQMEHDCPRRAPCNWMDLATCSRSAARSVLPFATSAFAPPANLTISGCLRPRYLT